MVRAALSNAHSKLEPTRMVPLFLLRGFWDELDKRGVSLAELERQCGVQRPQPGDCATIIPASDMHRMFEVSQALSGDPRIGLSAGRAIGATGFHLVGHLVLASATLKQAIDVVLRVQPQVRRRSPRIDELAGRTLRLGLLNGECALSAGARVEAEFAGVVLHDFVLHFFANASQVRPIVEFPFAAPEDTQPYLDMFPGGVRFGGEGTFVYFPRSALAGRRSGADAALREQLLQLALQQYGGANTEADWTSRVRSVLRAQSTPRLADAHTLASRLGVSVRGLGRRLAREGSSLTSLLEEALFERAKLLLETPDTTVAQVADTLGYAELSSFFRAFRRWSGGLTPAAYRRGQTG